MINQIPQRKKKYNTIKSYIFIFFSAILYTIGFQAFLQNARTFSTGITAFASLWTFVFDELVGYVSIITLIFNLPLLLFSYYKNTKKFTIRTSLFLVSQGMLGLLFLIPDVRNLFSTENIMNIDDIEKNKWAIWILSIIGSILMGLGITTSWWSGGSTGGIDIIAYYFSSKKQREIGRYISIISFAILILSFFISIILNDQIRSRWLITLFSSITYILIVTMLITFIYPKYKKIQVVISSDKTTEISDALKKTGYLHAWSVEQNVSGFLGKKKYKIITVMFLLELKDFTRFIIKMDNKAFITTHRIHKLFGHLSSRNIEEHF